MVIPAGPTRLHYEVGPIEIQPGQNTIEYTSSIPKPKVNGWIVRLAPNLRLADGSTPAVDVIHLHHGVWLNSSAIDSTSALPERFFAAGEEKTAVEIPAGYGYPYKATDGWILNYMIHNLWPTTTKIWIQYDIDFIAADSPAAVGIVPVRPIWTDVQNGSVYPVFDVIKGSGDPTAQTYTYPDEATSPYGSRAPKNEWVIDRDGIIVATAGHLHPGGLHTDMWLRRAGATPVAGHGKANEANTAHLFESTAHYWEPAGAVSWDVAMTATPPNWRVAVRKGDVLSTSATYDSSRASWYESMGIMVAWMADTLAPNDAAADPFVTAVDAVGAITHGHLAENDHHGGPFDPAFNYVDSFALASQPATSPIPISSYVYAQGDMLKGDPIPTVTAGGTITYRNDDASLGKGQWHTITACKAPCTGGTGIAYPVADADIAFDSGQLGVGGPPTAGRISWSTPTTLPVGTYTYFCRIHPAMRGAFRIAATP
ncbi:MAG: hypothetical protein F2735_01610 [Actinobacteria bacterium]|nr:hypothetical protein [Actinomycetota bacterium]